MYYLLPDFQEFSQKKLWKSIIRVWSEKQNYLEVIERNLCRDSTFHSCGNWLCSLCKTVALHKVPGLQSAGQQLEREDTHEVGESEDKPEHAGWANSERREVELAFASHNFQTSYFSD